MHLGGSVVSNHILENKAELKWVFREDAVDELDNGWRFLSEIDTEEYLSNPENMSVCDWSTIVEIEPAVLLIYGNQTFNKISSTNLENIDDILNDYLPLHLKWIEKGNFRIIKSLSESRQLDRQAFSQLLVGVRNLYIDLEELQDLLIEVSNEIDGN